MSAATPRPPAAPLARLPLARLPLAGRALGLPLLYGWRRRWLAPPSGEAVARLADGRALRCDLEDGTQRTMYLGLFEPAETRLVASLVRPGDTVVDVGAHIGWFATLCSRLAGPSGTVIAIEPYEANRRLLLANLELNGCGNVRVVEEALDETAAGQLVLARAGGDSGGATALEWAYDRPEAVRVRTLDGLAGPLERIDLVKIDVEGWEARVLRGGTEALARTERALIELNEPALRKAGSSARDVLGLLAAAGLDRVRHVGRHGLRRLAGEHLENVLVTRAPAP